MDKGIEEKIKEILLACFDYDKDDVRGAVQALTKLVEDEKIKAVREFSEIINSFLDVHRKTKLDKENNATQN